MVLIGPINLVPVIIFPTQAKENCAVNGLKGGDGSRRKTVKINTVIRRFKVILGRIRRRSDGRNDRPGYR